jgi:hypothetical protein
MHIDGWKYGAILTGMDVYVPNKKHNPYSCNIHKLPSKDKEQTYNQYYKVTKVIKTYSSICLICPKCYYNKTSSVCTGCLRGQDMRSV